MNVLLVHAHPEPKSLNAAWHYQAVDALQSQGHQVQICDLYAMDFPPELEKFLWADLLILNFADDWFSAPAMLKAWIDRLLVSGTCGGDKRFSDQRGLCGKKALVTVTLGGREHLYGTDAIHGLLEDKLRPILCGTLDYVGLEVLLPLVAWRVPYISGETAAA